VVGAHDPDAAPAAIFRSSPDGERFAVSAAVETPADAPRDKVVFIFNFFDDSAASLAARR